MLWAIVIGRRAVGVELRGDPFLGVHWNIRKDLYHQFGLIDQMMLELYGETGVLLRAHGKRFSLAEFFYSADTMAGDIVTDEIIDDGTPSSTSSGTIPRRRVHRRSLAREPRSHSNVPPPRQQRSAPTVLRSLNTSPAQVVIERVFAYPGFQIFPDRLDGFARPLLLPCWPIRGEVCGECRRGDVSRCSVRRWIRQWIRQ